MKKIIALMLAVLTVLSVSILFVSAGENKAKVTVTIADNQGKLALAIKEVTVTDIDNDQKLTINDALYAAHEQNYAGGAAAGYATGTTQYGLSLTKLWGIADGYNYGYMVNDASAWSLTDPVKEGDYIAAYCFTDNKTFADKYSYFTERKITAPASGEVTLTLKKSDYDKDWNPITLAVAGAQITVDGNPSSIFTDVNGQATVTLTGEGEHVISAVATNQVIVPPVCIAKIAAAGETTQPATEAATQAPTDAAQDPTQTPGTVEDVTEPATEPSTESATVSATEAPATSDQATKDQSTKDQSTKDQSASKTTTSPQTGDSTNVMLWAMITLFSLLGACAVVIIYRKRNEK